MAFWRICRHHLCHVWCTQNIVMIMNVVFFHHHIEMAHINKLKFTKWTAQTHKTTHSHMRPIKQIRVRILRECGIVFAVLCMPLSLLTLQLNWVWRKFMPVKCNFRWNEGKSQISIERIAWHLFALCQFLSSAIKHLFMWCMVHHKSKKKQCRCIYHFGIENEMIRSRWQIESIWVKWDDANRRQNVKIINLFSIKLKMKLVECFIIH